MLLNSADLLNSGLIGSISGTIDNTNRYINIAANGKSIIIVGANGSGKTSFLKGVLKSLGVNIIDGHFFSMTDYQTKLEQSEINLAADYSSKYSSESIFNIKLNINKYKKFLTELQTPFSLTFNNPEDFLSLYKSRKAVISIFEATRKANIKEVKSATGRQEDVSELGTSSNYGINLEQHLVNLEVRSGLAMRRGDVERVNEISNWFEKFTANLKYLFENEELELEFDDDKLCFFLSQPDRPKYSFQKLSSGYLAIFDIYADLLMRAEYREITPSELVGVVLIDEIDVHLHISLQRKILPFLMTAFPNIQFIVTTHSPFVVTSVDDAVIYDISTGRECDDLSMYSVEAVIEGLLGVPAISRKLEDIIKSLVNVTSIEEFDVDEVETLLNQISPSVDYLDDESKLFYQVSLNKFLKKKRRSA